jgi:hypothetical protein
VAQLGLADAEEDAQLGLYAEESYGGISRYDLFRGEAPVRRRARYGGDPAEQLQPPIVVDVQPAETGFVDAVKTGAGIAVGFVAVGAVLSLFGVIGRK